MSAPRHYEIRLFDRTLVEFCLSDDAFSPAAAIGDYDAEAACLMPCGLEPTPEGIWHWLETRSIPVNRRNAARICSELGFVLGDVEALYRTSLGLSLNDSYWVVPHGFAGRFADYNLFDNPFSEAIGALAVTGEVLDGNLAGNTPELTTDGTLRKGWRIINGKRVLYKGASEGFSPGEPISEYLSSLVGRDLGIDAVTYGLDTWHGELCSTCENFASKDVSYVPFAVATGISDLAGALWWCARLGQDAFDTFCNMLTLDALLCNTDRHFANFGVLRDNATGIVTGLAPMFDNGRGLFPNIEDDDAAQFALESRLRGPAFGGATFSEQLGRFLGKKQKLLLDRAAMRGIVGNALAPGRRVAALDAFLRTRANELQEIPGIDQGGLLSMLESSVAQRSPRNDGAYRIPLPTAG